jgi:CarD family transcriptional regulator
VTDVKAQARAKTEARKPRRDPKRRAEARKAAEAKRPVEARKVAEAKKPTETKKLVEAKRPPEREKPPYMAGDLVVYPTHGVGKITGIERQDIAGLSINVFVVHFDKDRMTLRVPTAKAQGSGLRRLSSRKEMDVALTRLKGRSRAKRTMWSRRAQEYEAKINSGDPASIAEVVRDLYRNVGQPEQSYSERQIYQAALDRLVREFAAVEKIDEPTAIRRLEQMLSAA